MSLLPEARPKKSEANSLRNDKRKITDACFFFQLEVAEKHKTHTHIRLVSNKQVDVAMCTELYFACVGVLNG